MTQRPTPGDYVTARVDRATDAELKTLILAIEAMTQRLPDDTPKWVKEFWADLATSGRGVLTGRVFAWSEILADPAVPPDWVTAIAALDLE
ncbi:hypothetical protein GCM10007079_33110 [Nocardiopsis terrae]|uniref:Uncharacterized protein n=1 Tax=Nocardiopsis terrae TaxID=372655 RepID=A0ABR9HJC4_9ACTN|nr:hypothetical protein [Nocardiopsis terrae]MBE1459125.1 hypothetical protein [Nocardiopsis terrae]GHC88280.1 hypothetical protein GCM10007079_33110 [Nocardiopsis terrae]